MLLLRRSRHSVCSRWRTRCRRRPSRPRPRVPPHHAFPRCLPCHQPHRPTAQSACARGHPPRTIAHPKDPTTGPMLSSTSTVSQSRFQTSHYSLLYTHMPQTTFFLHRWLRHRVRRGQHRRHWLPRTVSQLCLADVYTEDRTHHDRPGDVPKQRVPVRMLTPHNAARGGREQRRQHALGAGAARRGLRIPGARRRPRPWVFALCHLGGYRVTAASHSEHESQRYHGPM